VHLTGNDRRTAGDIDLAGCMSGEGDFGARTEDGDAHSHSYSGKSSGSARDFPLISFYGIPSAG